MIDYYYYHDYYHYSLSLSSCFRVTACNAAGESETSETSTAIEVFFPSFLLIIIIVIIEMLIMILILMMMEMMIFHDGDDDFHYDSYHDDDYYDGDDNHHVSARCLFQPGYGAFCETPSCNLS